MDIKPDVKPRDGVREINKVCKAVLKLQSEDFEEAYKIAQGQLAYNNPLRAATTGRQRELGEHNTKVLDALQNLQNVLVAGKDAGR